MNRRTATILLISLLAVGGLVFALWDRAKEQTFIFGNDHQLVLLGSTYGTNHVWVDGTPLQRFLARVPEDWLPESLVADKNNEESETPMLLLWFKDQSTNTGSPNTISVPGNIAVGDPVLSQSLVIVIEDENGVCSTVDTGWSSSTTTLGLDPIKFETFPRRGKVLTLRLLKETTSTNGQSSYTELGRMQIKNPVHENFPEWKPELLPITKTNGDLQITLTRLLTNVDPDSDEVPLRATNRWNPETWICLRVLENGLPTKDWTTGETFLSDATGNRTEVNGQRRFDDKGEGKLFADSIPWPDEPAWKINVELSRGTNFAADELVTFKGVPVTTNSITNGVTPSDTVVGNWSGNVVTAGVRSGPPSVYPLDMDPVATNTVQGFTIKMLNVNKILNLSPEFPDTYAVNFNTEPPLKGFGFTPIKATDQNGNDVLTSGSSASTSTSGNYYGFYAVSTNELQTVDVTFAIHKKRFVEFIAKPEMMK